ncbi:MAG: hypothetical protein QXH42_08545 [Thermoplasmata archaeon]
MEQDSDRGGGGREEGCGADGAPGAAMRGTRVIFESGRRVCGSTPGETMMVTCWGAAAGLFSHGSTVHARTANATVEMIATAAQAPVRARLCQTFFETHVRAPNVNARAKSASIAMDIISSPHSPRGLPSSPGAGWSNIVH